MRDTDLTLYAGVVLAALFLVALLLIVAGARGNKIAGVLTSAVLLGATVVFVLPILYNQVFEGIASSSHRSSHGRMGLWEGIPDFLLQDLGSHYYLGERILLPVICMVALLVALFSIYYMQRDARRGRYFGYLCFFVFAMLGLVLSDHLVQVFVFWELVGLASYLLIGFWYQKNAAAAAAKKAFIVNRLGDACFLAALALLYREGYSFSLDALAMAAAKGEVLSSPLVALFLFLGVLGKSAQFPLQVWLPDAMQGPTPVSALIHAATMVIAGVYLLIRVSPLLGPVLPLIAWGGAITALLGALSALNQTDIKKVLAYSTISQLGFMMLAIGSGVPQGAFFHLITHAFFKAGLFLCAGAVIHYLHEQQHAGAFPKNLDVQHLGNMGGLHRRLPLVSVAFALCGLSLAGLPLFSGFLSKEAILAGAFAGSAPLTGWLGVAVAALTPLYIARAWKLAFLGESQPELQAQRVGLPRLLSAIPLILGILSLWIWFGAHPLHPESSTLLEMLSVADHGARYRLIPTVFPAELPHAPFWLAPATVVLAIAGIGGVLLRKRPGRAKITAPASVLGRWLYHHFYLHRFYAQGVVPFTQALGAATAWLDLRVFDGLLHVLSRGQVVLAHVFGFFDRFVVDGLVNGLARLARWVGSGLSTPRSGQVQTYLIRALALSIILLAFLILW